MHYWPPIRTTAANQDLPTKWVSLGQQTFTITSQVDAPGLAQVGDPWLAVVRIGGQ